MPRDWVVTVDSHEFELAVEREGDRMRIFFGANAEPVALDLGGWRPGFTLTNAKVGDRSLTVKLDRAPSGFRLRWRGADTRAFVRTPRGAELARLMPVKVPPDTSKMLLCPMPGLVVSLHVGEGDEVQEGQPLATVEAMKMENILRAEKRAKVAKIHVAIGDSLAVDALMMEFG